MWMDIAATENTVLQTELTSQPKSVSLLTLAYGVQYSLPLITLQFSCGLVLYLTTRNAFQQIPIPAPFACDQQ